MIPLLLKHKTIQTLIVAVIGIVVMSALSLVVMGVTAVNLLLVMSGWTSIGALVLGIFLGIKAVKAELAITAMGGLESVVEFVAEFKKLLKSPEILALIDLVGNSAKNKKEE